VGGVPVDTATTLNDFTGRVAIVVPRGDVALVGDVDQDPGEELERVHGLGARRRALGLVGAIHHRLRGPVTHLLRNEKEYTRAVAEIDEILAKNPREGSAADDRSSCCRCS
jgi:hypothetical protein